MVLDSGNLFTKSKQALEFIFEEKKHPKIKTWLNSVPLQVNTTSKSASFWLHLDI